MDAGHVGKDAPTVSVGLPVYNGAETLRRALDSLLAQQGAQIEIIISDNCSTDRTPQIAEDYCARHGNIRYVRNETNIGALGNFLSALQHAHGTYFMWAAHDDTWSPQFVSRLVALLQRHPQAVLATPAAVYLHPDGSSSSHTSDRAAPGTSMAGNLCTLVEDHACCWIYGLFPTAWVKRNAEDLLKLPERRADFCWLFDVVLCGDVVGTDDATIFKAIVDRKYKQSQRERLWSWIQTWRTLAGSSIRRRRGRDRLVAFYWATCYCYSKYLRRGTLPGTAVRILKVLGMAGYFGLESLLAGIRSQRIRHRCSP
jgi:glycosyltransferase involved in cell wall biosynthesis